MGEADRKPFLFNVTVYTDKVEEMRRFYGDVVGLELMFHEEDHIACVGEFDRGLCAHEPESHPAGSRMFMFKGIDPVELEKRAHARGYEVYRTPLEPAGFTVVVVDPAGNLVGVQTTGEVAS